MSQLAALALSVGVLGGLAVWVFLSVGGILIWAAFIAWGCFFQSGGDSDALRNTIVCNIFGAVAAWLTAVIILAIPLADKLTLPLWAGIVAGIVIWIVVYAANIKAFAVIPASVYGFAAVFAFILQTPEKLNLASLMSLNFNNGLIVVAVSMVIGAILGFISGKVAAALTAKPSLA